MKSNINRFVCYILFIFSSPAMSQNLYVHPLPQETIRIGVKYLRPYFTQDADVEMKTMSGMYDIFMNMPMFKNFNFYVDVPIINQAYDDQTHGSGIGNVYLGLQTRPDSLDNIYTSTSFGIFLPTIKSNPSALSFLGVYASFQEPQKAMNNILTLYANYVYLIGEHHRKYIGFEIGPQFYIPMKSSAGTNDLYVHYGLSAGYAISNVIFTSEILGLAGVTSTFDTFGERFDHSLALAVSYEISDWRPILFYQIIIDDQASQIVNGILGIKLSLIYRR
jgi:hypothetical protein